MLLDQPLLSGDADGHGEFHGYPFLSGGSTGFPDATAVLRSYGRHEAIELLFVTDDPEAIGGVVLEEPDLERNEVCFTVHDKAWTGIDGFRESLAEAQVLVDRHGLPVAEALAGVLLPPIGNQIECDAIVTSRPWLLAQRAGPHARYLAHVFSPEEALALVGLFLRWHQDSVIIGGSPIRWGPVSMRRAAAYAMLPSYWRWAAAAPRNHAGYDPYRSLASSCMTRAARALAFRDAIHGLSVHDARRNADEMLAELDSLLYSLVGAFDITARLADLYLNLNTPKFQVGWQKQAWRTHLNNHAPELAAFTAEGGTAHRVMKIAAVLRNTVHSAALHVTGHRLSTGEENILVTVPPDEEQALLGWLDTDADAWGVQRMSGGRTVLDAGRFVEQLVPAALGVLEGTMARTPLDRLPGFTPTPSHLEQDWKFCDTTGHRLRLLYGLPEPAPQRVNP
ncbi:hypothetical protein ABZ541_29105 [Micromonospora sediminicola]|uniref:hypothetical protein n=1 Tax=Micromonospora sediminicola TaxID=946078 RepID=UPI0033C2077C